MNPPVMIVTFLATIVFGATLIGLGLVYYQKNTAVKYSFLNRFMFEILLALNDNQRRLIQIPMALFFTALATFFATSFLMPGIVMTFLIFAAALLSSGAYAFLFYVKTTIVDRHVLVASLAMMLTLLLALLVGYYSFSTPFDDTFNEVLKFGSITIALWQLLIMINPRLKNWGQLTQVKDGNAVSYSRPKVFVLPLSEWLSLFNLILLQIIIIISVII